ncbi:uncharacterized protein isoform X1 [Danio rerio]|uniref:Uncharacterized protein isoform X1 n=1 Tax=Danio rerio TaxID=7955 RepID=A0AC58H975_DANRE
MRRFFRVDRDEDFGQIQYLTAKCIRLSQEKAVLQQELLVSAERQQALQAQMEVLAVCVRQKEQLNVELNIKYEQLQERFQQQLRQADVLQQCVLSVTEDRCRDASLLGLQLEQVSCDLQQMQSSEAKLMGLVDELHQEAQLRAQQAEVLQAQLHLEAQSKTQTIEELETQLNSKARELAELQISHDAVLQDVCIQRGAHQRTLEELRRTADQCEWVCEQQRRWMSCVRRFKDCLSGEKESLELQVNRLQVELETVRRSEHTEHCSRWDEELQTEAERWRTLYEDLLKLTTQQGQQASVGHLKPP